mmetsp:Transcript_1436/g.2974  ORF Transcript_1436/g.2974 Transcript_1436/m.2974 type:complete len:114 (+) Transcript_1436:1493-1834(+)
MKEFSPHRCACLCNSFFVGVEERCACVTVARREGKRGQVFLESRAPLPKIKMTEDHTASSQFVRKAGERQTLIFCEETAVLSILWNTHVRILLCMRRNRSKEEKKKIQKLFFE